MCYNSRVSGCGRFFGCAVRQKFRGVPEMKEDFKEIEILNSNEEYSIIRSNTAYGLVAYDYIVLDADSVETDEFIYE